MSQEDRFTVGGAVEPTALYVERSADQQILESLERGEYCYVLAPRQIGKSSLRLRTENKLIDKGFRVSSVDLATLGTQEPREDWYEALAREIAHRLHMDSEVRSAWSAGSGLTCTARLLRCLELLHESDDRALIVFLDEIDTVIRLDFGGDDLFAALRGLTQMGRGRRRPTFALLGVAEPQELMRDPLRTPFNIGRRIELDDFTRAQVDQFGELMGSLGDDAQPLLDQVYEWTDGHPYMTQKLCLDLVTEERRGLPHADETRRLVEKAFLESPNNDSCLRFAHTRFSAEFSHVTRQDKLSLYRRLYFRDPVEPREADPAQNELFLAGMVKVVRDGGLERLVIRNRIYREVFSEGWMLSVDAHPELGGRIHAWLGSGKSERHLLGGDELQRLEGSARDRPLPPDQREFLEASRALLRLEEAARLEAETRRRRALVPRVRLLSTTSGREVEALSAALQAVAPLTAGPTLPPPEAVEALVLACTEVFGRTRSRWSRPDWSAFPLASCLPASDVASAAFSPDGCFVVTAGADGMGRVWDAATSRETLHVRCPGPLHDARLSPDGRVLITAGRDTRVRLWSYPSGDPLRELDGHTPPVRIAAISADGSRMATLDGASVVRLWDPADRHWVRSLDNLGEPVWQLAFSPGGEILAIAARDTVHLWDCVKDQPVGTLVTSQRGVRQIAFGAGLVFVAAADGTIQALRNGQVETVLEGHSGPVLALGLSPDGTMLLSGGADRTARLWELRDGRSLGVMDKHLGSVRAATFSPQGRMGLTVSGQVAALWPFWEPLGPSPRPTVFLRGHEGWVRSATFSPTGNTVLTVSGDGSAKLFHASIEAWIDVADALLAGLSEIERA